MNNQRQLGLWGAVAIGVGGMVGGGIFAVLGLSVALSGGGAPIAFLIAGAVALLTAYSYAKLSVAYPSQGGTVEFLNRAFGTGAFSGTCNVLLWLSYIVMLSLYAYAFGSYAASLVDNAGNPWVRHGATSLAVILLTALNALGVAAVGRAETWIVALKIGILLLFIAAGLGSIDTERLAPASWASPLALTAGGMLIFLAYEGFELIANTARDIRDPQRTLPRAYFIAVGSVIALYVVIAAVTVGSLPLDALVQARDYALAAAARPTLGQAGFTLIAVAALLSTASAINATLYGAARVSYVIAKEGELPKFLEHRVWRRPIEGLLITAAATLLIANLADLSSIAIMGSAGFLLIFAVVNAANLRCARRAHSRRWIAALGTTTCLAALLALVGYSAQHDPKHLVTLPAMLVLSLGIELAYQRFGRHRHTEPRR